SLLNHWPVTGCNFPFMYLSQCLPGAPHIRVLCQCVGDARVISLIDCDTSATNRSVLRARQFDCDPEAFRLCRKPTHRNARDAWAPGQPSDHSTFPITVRGRMPQVAAEKVVEGEESSPQALK